MVYMAGDNNLTGEMAQTLDQIKSVTGSNANLSLYVYFDSISRNVPTLYCDFSGPTKSIRYFRSTGIEKKLIMRKGDHYAFNENSASMNNIINFIHWCVEKDKTFVAPDGSVVDQRPNKRYALIFSGHSFGFLDWGLLKDESSDYYMTLRKLRWLFERITFTKEQLVEQADVDQAEQDKDDFEAGREPSKWTQDRFDERTTEVIGKSLDLLGFDSCEMSSLEIASQFRGLAKTLVASEGTVPNSGWNYADILLGTLGEKPNADPNAVAVSFVNEFIKQQNRLALADVSADMAAWSLNDLPELEKAFGTFARRLFACFAEKGSVPYRQMRRLLTHAHWQCQTYSFEQHADLSDLCELLIEEINYLESEIDASHFTPIGDVRASCKDVIKALRHCVLLTGYSGSDFQFSKGISVFFPWSLASYDSAKADYKKLHFINATEAGQDWLKFLRHYLREVSMRPANQVTPVDQRGVLRIPEGVDSVVYESYTLLDEVHNAVFPAVVPSKETTKRPPDSGRRPPNSSRTPTNMSIFLSRFMKLKNFEPSWNRTGFTSTRFPFVRGGTKPDRSLDIRSVEIPIGDGIKSKLDHLLLFLEAGKKDTASVVNFREILEAIKQVSAEPDEDRKIEMYNDLTKSKLLKSNGALVGLTKGLGPTVNESISGDSFDEKLASMIDEASKK